MAASGYQPPDHRRAVGTATGHVLRDNPFGVVDVVGGRNRFLVKLARESTRSSPGWTLPTSTWRIGGDKDSATFTLASHVPADPPRRPAAGAYGAPAGRVTLRWQARHPRSDRILCLSSGPAHLRLRADQRSHGRHHYTSPTTAATASTR